MYKLLRGSPLLLLLLTANPSMAGDTKDAAIGGGVGGALGGAIGAEIGDRNGAIVGAAAGAALGAAVATDDEGKSVKHEAETKVIVSEPAVHVVEQPAGRFCPPGQAKKGRC